MGVGRDHLRLVLTTPDGLGLDAVGFGMADHVPDEGQYIEIAGALSINRWGGSRARLQVKVNDHRPFGQQFVD